MFRQIKPTLKLPRRQEAQALVRPLVLVLENPLVNYLLHLPRAHRLVVVVKALGLQRSDEPLDERLVLRPVRAAPVLPYPDIFRCQPPLRLPLVREIVKCCGLKFEPA